MLKSLSVSNLAIVERAEVEFGPGLNVITGETGAGKSVLMGALDLVLGGRAEASSVRDGATEAEVEAVFESESRGGGRRAVVIRRTLTREGRSRAWVNDESVSIAELRELGHGLVDIHGPRANQRLLDEDFQRETLDASGHVDVRAYAAAYARYTEASARLRALREGPGAEELDFLRFQVNELEEAALSEEDETIAERHAAAAHAEEIISEANAITEALGGDGSAADLLSSLRPKFAAIARHLPAAEAWASEAEDMTVRIEELSRTVADAVSRIDAGEEDLASLDARLTVVNRLKRKYLLRAAPVAADGEQKSDIARLLDVLADKKARLDLAEGRDEKIAEAEKALAEAESGLRTVGAALSKTRVRAGAKLSRAITEELRGLGFLQARLAVSVEAAEPGPHGLDRIVFMFEPNPGEAARPLAAIASSGEIARVMLAVKVVVADSALRLRLSSSPTLVFDEIDANIGGEVGKVVGEKMRAVAEGRQVIAITHLPQSAAYGARHLVVSKSVSEGRTRTHVTEVKGAGRVAEIARMLGGEGLTSVVKRHAEELLEVSR